MYELWAICREVTGENSKVNDNDVTTTQTLISGNPMKMNKINSEKDIDVLPAYLHKDREMQKFNI